MYLTARLNRFLEAIECEGCRRRRARMRYWITRYRCWRKMSRAQQIFDELFHARLDTEHPTREELAWEKREFDRRMRCRSRFTLFR